MSEANLLSSTISTLASSTVVYHLNWSEEPFSIYIQAHINVNPTMKYRY